MTNSAKESTAITNKTALNFTHPYYVPIEDGDEVTIKYYKNNDIPIVHIALPGRMKHYYAVFDAVTQEKANLMKRTFNNWEKKDMRDAENRSKAETSYESLLEEGYNPSSSSVNLDEIIAYKAVIKALQSALDELTEEKLCICQMLATGESQRSVAEKLGISRRTLRGRKDATMKELERKLKNYR